MIKKALVLSLCVLSPSVLSAESDGRVGEWADKAGEMAREGVAKAKELGEDGKVVWSDTKEYVGEKSEQAKDYYEDNKDKISEAAEVVAEKSEGVMGFLEDKYEAVKDWLDQ